MRQRGPRNEGRGRGAGSPVGAQSHGLGPHVEVLGRIVGGFPASPLCHGPRAVCVQGTVAEPGGQGGFFQGSQEKGHPRRAGRWGAVAAGGSRLCPAEAGGASAAEGSPRAQGAPRPGSGVGAWETALRQPRAALSGQQRVGTCCAPGEVTSGLRCGGSPVKEATHWPRWC